MDKQAYIASVRQLEEKYTRIESRKVWWATLLGGSRKLARAEADVMEQYVRELQALEPPSEDAEALERGFLHPIQERAGKWSARADRSRHWRGKPETPEPYDYQRDLDFIDFCVDYGLVDPPDWKLRATFDERLRDVGLTPTPVVAAHGLSDAQIQRMRRGGMPRGFGWLARLGSNPGNGRSIADAITSHPAPTSAVCVTMQQGMGWVCFFVDGDAPDFPVGALLLKAPPRRWRDRPTFVTIHGDPRPGGRFAVEFPDGTLRLSKGRSRLAPWPPKPPRKVFGVIVG